MFGFTVIETATGLILVFLVMSLICSAVREMVESLLKQRALDLERGIRELLQDPDGTGLAKELYSHPLVGGLFEGSYAPRNVKGTLQRWFGTGGTLPSYIPSPTFARALIDLYNEGKIDKINNPLVVGAFRALSQESGSDMAQLRINLENWFDNGTQRIGGWYKRRTQAVLLALGLIAAGTMNVNTLIIADQLYHRSDLRSAVIATAERTVAEGGPQRNDAAEQVYRDNVATLNSMARAGLPMGWGSGPARDAALYIMLCGWLMTAIAVTFGAPFWFDLLNKFVVLRSSIKPPEKKADDSAQPSRPASMAVFPATAGIAAVGQPVLAATGGIAQALPAQMEFEPHQWRDSDEEEGDL